MEEVASELKHVQKEAEGEVGERANDNSQRNVVAKKGLQIAAIVLLISIFSLAGYLYWSQKERKTERDGIATARSGLPAAQNMEPIETNKSEKYLQEVVAPLSNKTKTDFNNFSPHATVGISEKNKFRLRFYFPQTSIGKLHDNGGGYSEAMGIVKMPENHPMALEVREQDQGTWSQVDILEKIDGRYLDELWFRRDGIIDDDLLSDRSMLAMLKTASKWKHFSGVRFIGFKPSKQILDFVQSLPHLERLAITNTTESANELASRPFLQKLVSLELSGLPEIDPILLALAKSDHLRFLIINETKPAAATLMQLKSCPNLFYLSFVGGAIDDQQLTALSEVSSLKHLILRNAHVNVNRLCSLKGFKNLRELSIDGWKPEELSQFKKNFPQCALVKEADSRPTVEAKEF